MKKRKDKRGRKPIRLLPPGVILIRLFQQIVRQRLRALERKGKEITNEERREAHIIKWASHEIAKKLMKKLKRKRPLREKELRRFTGAMTGLIRSRQIIDEGGPHGNHEFLIPLD